MKRETPVSDPSRCPLCGQANQCQLCQSSSYKGPCWCASVEIPDALLACVPREFRNRACICESCVREFHRTKRHPHNISTQPGDFYFDANGLVVFTEQFLKRRGYCCGSGCRHCPYPE
jgi:hypothetical protein